MKKIISTVGTSLFTNNDEIMKILGNNYDELNDKEASEWKYYKNKFLQKIERILRLVDKESSAELKSIYKLAEKFGKEHIDLYFLCSDTIISIIAAEILTKFLKSQNFNIEFNPDLDIIKDLQVEDNKSFKIGMSNLIHRINIIAGGYYDNVVLNITGGFKATIPYMTIMGQIHKMPVFYIFENSDALIEIPHIPLMINEKLIEKYEKQLDLVNENPVKESELDYYFKNECAGLLDIIQDNGNHVFLNTLGKMLFEKYKSGFITFYCPDNIRQEIEGKSEIKSLIKEKYANIIVGNKLEKKEEHYVYDDGNNCNRIFHFIENEKLYIYKIFTANHKEYESYINKPFDKNKIVKESKFYKIKKEESQNV